jgi:nucleoside-diphosphate-sugar epimerase
MRLFITGASGFIGTAVVAEMLAAGHDVIGLARSRESADRLTAQGADVLEGSLDDLSSLHTAAAAADGVIHLGFRHADPFERAISADREAIDAIGNALVGSGKPFLFASGTLVLAPGAVRTEADEPDAHAPAAARGVNETLGLQFAERGVRVSAVRLAPSVHDEEKRGFAGALVDIASTSGLSGYVGDGTQRWPTVHRLDAARLFRLAVEDAPAGSVLHGVGEEGVPLRAIAEVIGAGLGVPVRSLPVEQAAEHFGWLAGMVSADSPASSEATRALLGWEPTHRGLLEDLKRGHFLPAAA